MSARLLALTLVWLTLLAGGAAGHVRSESFSTWRVEGAQLSGEFQVDAHRATQLIATDAEARDLNATLARHLRETIAMETAAGPCAMAEAPAPRPAEPGRLRMALSYDCPGPIGPDARLRITAFAAQSSTHVHYLRVRLGAESTIEAALSGGVREITLAPRLDGARAGFWRTLRLGFEHVLSGLDHLAFLLALALMAGSWTRAAWAASGFTLGHSISLGLVAAGVVRPFGPAVEALIGFTVAFAAGEALRTGRDVRWALAIAGALGVLAMPALAAGLGWSSLPWPVFLGAALFTLAMARFGSQDTRPAAIPLAAAFGLAHGAGFAGPFLELGVEGPALLPALVAFNLGVEAAQLLALCVIAALALAAARIPAAVRGHGRDVLCAALGGLGVYWFASRAVWFG